MKLDVKIQLLRFCFQVFNFIFLALGLSVGAFGLWILFGQQNLLTALLNDELEVGTVGVGFALVGAVVSVGGVIGCVGAERGNRLLLLTYVGFHIVLVLGQLFLTLLLLINRDKIESGLDTTVDKFIVNYGGDHHHDDRLMDSVQRFSECCGRTGPSDWKTNSFVKNNTGSGILPCSCFSWSRRSADSPWCVNMTSPLYGYGNDTHTEGCKDKVAAWFEENTLTVVGMVFGLILIQVIQFALAGQLYRAVGRKSDLKNAENILVESEIPREEEEMEYGEENYSYMDHEEEGYYIDPAYQEYLPDERY